MDSLLLDCSLASADKKYFCTSLPYSIKWMLTFLCTGAQNGVNVMKYPQLQFPLSSHTL